MSQEQITENLNKVLGQIDLIEKEYDQIEKDIQTQIKEIQGMDINDQLGQVSSNIKDIVRKLDSIVNQSNEQNNDLGQFHQEHQSLQESVKQKTSQGLA